MATRKTVTKKTVMKNAAPKKTTTKSPSKASTERSKPGKPSVSVTKKGKDPKGGLTQAGRDAYNSKTGSNLKPGVKGAADTPEKKRRKGSFLTRHYTTPRGPVVKDGEPTRQALQAAAWGEPVPKTEADEKKLAAKGRKLLGEYKSGKGGASS